MSIPSIKNPPDPIVEEIHATRRKLLEEHGGLDGLFAFLREEEAKSKRPIVGPNGKAKGAITPAPEQGKAQ